MAAEDVLTIPLLHAFRNALQVIPGEVTPAGLNCLAASGLISQLRQLALYDSELPAGCLSSVLKGAGRLTSLQLGLSNVDDLGALGKLPQLQVSTSTHVLHGQASDSAAVLK